ncbi:hypothetical protein [Sporosarcina sp. YIM B06819]|nr:hypothetical protein [Sporosarcina sp. YIM B06819]
MKGQHLVIGLVLFVIVIVVAIYFSVMATFNKVENSMESVVEVMDYRL